MRKLKYMVTIFISLIGMFIGVFFLRREAYINPRNLVSDLISDAFQHHFLGYIISFTLIVFFFTLLISSTIRYFFKRKANINNYDVGYHSSNTPF